MPKTLREQLPTLIELLTIEGWKITILPSTLSHVQRVECFHEKYGNLTTAGEGKTLEDALAPFEAELHESTQRKLRAERGIHPPERIHCRQLCNRLTSDIDWCPACGALRVNGGEWTAPVSAATHPIGDEKCTNGHPWSPLIGSCIGVGCGAIKTTEANVIQNNGKIVAADQPHDGGQLVRASTIERDEYACVWTVGGPAKARMFFGVGASAEVVCLQEAPFTTQEKEKYRPEAKLYGVKAGMMKGEEHATKGALRHDHASKVK